MSLPAFGGVTKARRSPVCLRNSTTKTPAASGPMMRMCARLSTSLAHFVPHGVGGMAHPRYRRDELLLRLSQLVGPVTDLFHGHLLCPPCVNARRRDEVSIGRRPSIPASRRAS